MQPDASNQIVQQIMLDFADLTGLDKGGNPPQRYLWTDAFAVCNFLELYRRTQKVTWRDLALRLVDQVHHILGRHRGDDPRSGWISGLGEEEGELHPTIGGLRIGKQLNERGPGEPPDERREWDRDGQYYHYLTKWMQALLRVTRATGDRTYAGWALELAQTTHAGFSHVPSRGPAQRLYWKMSIDLSRPLVRSMGQHDPLDGMVTYSELQAATKEFGTESFPGLQAGIADMAAICQGREWGTDDPLGIGGLLCDASRIAQLMIRGAFGDQSLLENVVDSALPGLEAILEGDSLEQPAGFRLAFRELGLSIGLKGAVQLLDAVTEHPEHFDRTGSLPERIAALLRYLPLAENIENFWLDSANRVSGSWREHREINMVMLATSLAPEGFLII